MRIEGLSHVAQLYGRSNVARTEKKVTAEKDKVQISQAGQDYQVARRAVAQTPDVREELVADIKKRVDAGTYEVSGDAFAEKVIARYSTMMR